MTSNAMMPLLRNLGLLLVSCLAGLLLCEASLRLFYPKYAPLAEARARFDTMRIWARIPNDRASHLHPDTGSMHTLHHNNLALRQHRNFSPADLTAVNVGVFGDSFVENRGIDAPYSLTEPLDYLLNQRGQRFNVLNFGVAGYGTGQSLLHYEHFRYAEDLAYVFYVYYENDLAEIVRTALFDPDEAGRLCSTDEEVAPPLSDPRPKRPTLFVCGEKSPPRGADARTTERGMAREGRGLLET